MISWLKGKTIQKWELSSKKGIVLDVGGVGYEVQLLSKQISLIDKSKSIEFWIHQVNREDCTNLYGFNEVNQRDLFRIIIGINGIGPQIAMALLEDIDVEDLVEAIEENDLKILTRAQGVGKRIAERLVVELKNKLEHYKHINKTKMDIQSTKQSNNFAKYLEEIKSILNSLGYMDNEINDSIEVLGTNQKEITLLLKTLSTEAKTDLMDKHLKEILIRLSQNST
tara:strand:- start:125 stop:799 length:675 start_codon:yes stop_codon:yes gene_type:complete